MDCGAPAALATDDGLCAELGRELKNHAYGLRSFGAPTAAGRRPPRARAAVELLEDTAATVELGADGYALAPAEPGAPARRFETLTALLQDASPAFGRAMHAALLKRLCALPPASQ
ncbi:hypothetical protein IWQ57_004833 [Coemansia nantahalensis]|uniref:Uncharacterized protein n=2 Tax=Coemansia TaxID=4863 RepID=A0ACC1KIE9_9FUNG|nr:hypothetical protein IWQ57_004833 [Coemansia nantahalensis]KAJ2790552.1 hypothetical protein H4R21_006486 [Coemansia helicoidea]